MKCTLVLLPGLNGTDGLFDPLIKVIAGEVRVLPVSYPTDDKCSYKELTDLVLDKIKSIDGEFILLGESFSGPLSLFVARKQPAGLLGVILVASFISAPNLRVGRFLPWKFGFVLTKPLYKLRLAFSDTASQSFVRAISTELQKVAPQVLAHRIQQVFDVNAEEALKACAVPVVYLRGSRDLVVPKRNLTKILTVKPGVKVIEFKTQHFLLQSEPQKAWVSIKKFIETVST